ncbi:bifunctional hydroxymethylpyrimidine kinase/phosphomethylpyrimidine kinase [Lysinibacillus piscis]|uniref:Hydroxymethylpyrimidine/phosphomethylpyrimidine kinase n=1 Tax=Lysinibacillus piscis TaxID=2518931 RepID=A0ABQ5NIT8_9BACI|nr:bifunctional hydroxymethylpyrimidine kinase/phosphomethylpyrimidine kinase [Lysinibacillus sp. KH24]GLC88286.1 hydroxymethylpyrimidine/phosphomethylpyrimidine kinase [Lysinibacillus sp. KH24]
MHVVTTIAGSDSGGGAGIQADLKTFQELHVFGTSVITALTAQNTLGVSGVLPIEAAFIQQQFFALLEDFDIRAVKTGMLFSADIIHSIAQILQHKQLPLVVDPVMIAKGGASLLQQQAIEAMRSELLPLATILTPNIPEAETLTGQHIETVDDIHRAAQTLLQVGGQCIIIKGGHFECSTTATDYVFFQDGRAWMMTMPRIETLNTHGTGCTFSAALTAFLGNGLPIEQAIIEAKKFIHLAITHDLKLGHGHGPTNHFAYQQYQGSCEVIVHEA